MISVITDASFAKMNREKCYFCGKPGHYSNNCREKRKPKRSWQIHCQVQHMNIEKKSSEREQANEKKRK